MNRYLGFPELLLLLILPFTGGTYFLLSSALIISLAFHIVLRYKYPTHYPAFGSWVHVFLSGLCWVLFVLMRPAGEVPTGTGLPEAVQFITGVMWYSAAGVIRIVMMGVQVLFWVGATHSLWERGKMGVRRRRVID